MQISAKTDAQLYAVPRSVPQLPQPRDCETLYLWRCVLMPVVEGAHSWQALAQDLSHKGYGLGFCRGHLVILDEAGAPLCTGSSLGTPLRDLAARLGRPNVRAHANGVSGVLH
ncbi:MAG: hypothetical protein N4A53_09280 [Pelagimonas sp.]|jgi:hypothetical protein|nr:hypothetical protein [Pelagimonas sp.]